MNKLIETIKKRPGLFSISFILFLALNSLLNGTYITMSNFFSSYKLWFAITFAFVNLLIIPFLVAATVILTTQRVIELKTISKKKGVLGLIGTFFAILGGACPGCFAGIFPAVLGLFGFAINLSILPLKGLEISFISIVLLIIALYYLSKDITCKIEIKK